MPVLTAALAILVAGGIVFNLLVIFAVWRFLRETRPAAKDLPAISILKPLAGLEPDLETNLASFFEIDYPNYELLFAAREARDPALAVVARLEKLHPQIPVTRIIAGGPPSREDFPNAKVYSLLQMAAQARHDLLVISDSDIRAGKNYLHGIAADFQDPQVGVSTYPYRAVPGASFWSRLEALGMNSHFWGGVIVARLLGGMDFAVGPTMAIRRHALEALGGFHRFRQYLAEDFEIGRAAADAGYRVVLSRHVVEHHIGGQPLGANLSHRLRWRRSTRRSRPAGYVGEVFTFPLPFALVLTAVTAASPASLALLAACVTTRLGALAAVGPTLLLDRLAPKYFWLTPLEDTISLAVWAAGFFGRTIVWRDRRYRLLKGGRLRPEPIGKQPRP